MSVYILTTLLQSLFNCLHVAALRLYPVFPILGRVAIVDITLPTGDRWESIRPDQGDFLPFGRGPRACIGRERTLLEASYVLIIMARKFKRIESRDERDYKAEMKLTCGNGNGCKVALFE